MKKNWFERAAAYIFIATISIEKSKSRLIFLLGTVNNIFDAVLSIDI